MKTKDKFTAIIITCTLALTAGSKAKTFVVAEGGSIQDAIDSAADSPGTDTVLLRPGTYLESFEIEDDDPLTLRRTGDVTIDADDVDEDVIGIDGGNVTIQNVAITGGDDGIDAKDGDLTLINVDVSGNDDRGVEADDMGSVRVQNANFSDNGGDGIKVEDADRLLMNRVSSIGNNDGFDLEVIGSITAHYVVANGNDDEGFEVDDCGSVNMTHGAFANNFDDGIDIDDTAEITLNSVVSTGNGFGSEDGNGFQAEAEDFETEQITLIKCLFADNFADGVQITEDPGAVGDVTLKSVDALDNGGSGLNIAASGTVTLKGVVSGTAAGNGSDDVLP